MDTGARLEVLWNDADIFEVRMAAWNGLFGGSANIYVCIGGLAEAAEKLKGFPRTPFDKRTLDFGAFGPRFAGGAATIDFYGKDSAGHASVQVRIESDHRRKIPAQICADYPSSAPTICLPPLPGLQPLLDQPSNEGSRIRLRSSGLMRRSLARRNSGQKFCLAAQSEQI